MCTQQEMRLRRELDNVEKQLESRQKTIELEQFEISQLEEKKAFLASRLEAETIEPGKGKKSKSEEE